MYARTVCTCHIIHTCIGLCIHTHAHIYLITYLLAYILYTHTCMAPWGWPLFRTRGYVILRGSRDGSVGSAFDCEPMCCRFESSLNISVPPVLRDWVIKGLGMYSRACATGHIKDPVPLIEKRRGLSSGGRFPPSFIHQVIITGLNKLYNRMFSPSRWP